jgi:hypothetical protein
VYKKVAFLPKKQLSCFLPAIKNSACFQGKEFKGQEFS